MKERQDVRELVSPPHRASEVGFVSIKKIQVLSGICCDGRDISPSVHGH